VVTWPYFSDQSLNEKLAVEVLGIGLSIGIKEPAMGMKGMVRREMVHAAVSGILDGGDDGEERRKRARSLAGKARAALQEGGSSHANLRDLVKRFGAGDEKLLA
jgi:hypothetical protein